MITSPAYAEHLATLRAPHTMLPLDQYDKILVMFSGGKDSLACVIKLLEMGVPRHKLELWHHLVDGPCGDLMDWPCTESYCSKIAMRLGIEIRFSWRSGGFAQEMLRYNSPTGAVLFETGDHTFGKAGGNGPKGTRRKFPQVSADLKVRWCSAYLKIDVARRQLANDPRFASGTFLMVSGERREESAARSRYAESEFHACNKAGRRVDQWRAVIDWGEQEVWDAMRRWKIRPHPAYRLGWGRLSCLSCIFGQADQWASVRALAPAMFERIADYEAEFGVTIQRGKNVRELADSGTSYLPEGSEDLQAISLCKTWEESAIQDPWELPCGAFKRTGGPT